MERPSADPAIIKEFRKRRQRQIMAVSPFAVVLVGMILLDRAGRYALWGIPSATLVPGLVAALFVILVFSFWNWRCPACRRYLGKNISPRFCQSCGVQLSE